MKIGIVVPSRNEGAWLEKTVRSIRDTTPADTEVIHVNDASTHPEPDLSKYEVKEIRLPVRRGAAMARAIGMCEASPDCDVLGTVDGHELFGPGECLAALIEENQRFISRGALPQNYTCSAHEAKVHLAPNKILTVASIALEHDCFAYMSPCRMAPGTARFVNGFVRVGFLERREGYDAVSEKSAMNGGAYFGSRKAWETIGGYPQLPGHFGFEEEALALLAAGFSIKILCATELSPWHVYRSQGVDPIPCPYSTAWDKEEENLASVYRIAFSQSMWRNHWRTLLAKEILPGRPRPIPEYVLCEVEKNEALTQYRDSLVSAMRFKDEELLTELQRRRSNDEQLPVGK